LYSDIEVKGRCEEIETDMANCADKLFASATINSEESVIQREMERLSHVTAAQEYQESLDHVLMTSVPTRDNSSQAVLKEFENLSSLGTVQQLPDTPIPVTTGDHAQLPDTPIPLTTGDHAQLPDTPIPLTTGHDLMNEFDSNDRILLGTFPWLFPLGIGVVGKGSQPPSFTEYLMCYYDGRFQADSDFVFLLFNQRRRHLASSGISLHVRNNESSIDVMCNVSYV
jgi:hypothetical protein